MSVDPEMVAQLRPVRLPPGYEAFSWDIVLAAFSMGVLLAFVVILLLRVVTRRRPTAASLAGEELAQARNLEPHERLFRQAALLDRLVAGRRGGTGPADRTTVQDDLEAMRRTFRETLYRRGETPDLDAIDAALLELADRLGSRRLAGGRSARRISSSLTDVSFGRTGTRP